MESKQTASPVKPAAVSKSFPFPTDPARKELAKQILSVMANQIQNPATELFELERRAREEIYGKSEQEMRDMLDGLECMTHSLSLKRPKSSSCIAPSLESDSESEASSFSKKVRMVPTQDIYDPTMQPVTPFHAYVTRHSRYNLEERGIPFLKLPNHAMHLNALKFCFQGEQTLEYALTPVCGIEEAISQVERSRQDIVLLLRTLHAVYVVAERMQFKGDALLIACDIRTYQKNLVQAILSGEHLYEADCAWVYHYYVKMGNELKQHELNEYMALQHNVDALVAQESEWIGSSDSDQFSHYDLGHEFGDEDDAIFGQDMLALEDGDVSTLDPGDASTLERGIHVPPPPPPPAPALTEPKSLNPKKTPMPIREQIKLIEEVYKLLDGHDKIIPVTV